MRAFVAVELPEVARAALGRLQRQLVDVRAEIAWVAEPNLHVTLRFLGAISDEQCRSLEEALVQVGCMAAPLRLGLGSVGAFPSVDAPSVIWVGVTEGVVALARLAGLIEQAVRELAPSSDDRPFSPHVTIGRVRAPQGRVALGQRLRDLSWDPPATWMAASIALVRSTLTSSGPRYTILKEIPLRGESGAP